LSPEDPDPIVEHLSISGAPPLKPETYRFEPQALGEDLIDRIDLIDLIVNGVNKVLSQFPDRLSSFMLLA